VRDAEPPDSIDAEPDTARVLAGVAGAEPAACSWDETKRRPSRRSHGDDTADSRASARCTQPLGPLRHHRCRPVELQFGIPEL